MKNEIIRKSYKIEKVKDEPKKWMVVRYSETKRGCNIGKIFEGTRQECKQRLEEIKNDKTRIQ